MGWFLSGQDDSPGWRLDIVSLLAVVGESAMADHVQAMTSSWLCVLPRILPAPQALLKPSRPSRLPASNAFVVGVYNGTFIETLNYFANIIHPVEELPSYYFQVYNIRKRCPPNVAMSPASPPPLTEREREPELESKPDPSRSGDTKDLSCHHTLEAGLHRRPTLRPHLLNPAQRPNVPPRYLSPLNMLAVFSCILTLAMLALAVYKHDGVAVLALLTISLVSSTVGLASKWSPQLMNRKFRTNVPPGDVVIRLRQGALIVVHCDEEVARELYSGMEECAYTISTIPYRILVGFGTFLLMVSVVLLGNCGFTMQLAIGISYIVLNGLFWAAALCERDWFWNLSAYEWEDATPAYAQNATVKHQGGGGGDDSVDAYPSLTRTLWYAILETKRIGWVKKGKAAPRTPRWERWLHEAERQAKMGNVHWDAVRQMNLIVGMADEEEKNDDGQMGGGRDIVEHVAPALEVPPQERR